MKKIFLCRTPADIPDVLINNEKWDLFNAKPLENAYMNEEELFDFISNKKDDDMGVVL